MSKRFEFKVPDLGEGTVSSEIVAWRVQVGDLVREDDPLAELSTDKAVVEVPAPVSGRVLALNGRLKDRRRWKPLQPATAPPSLPLRPRRPRPASSPRRPRGDWRARPASISRRSPGPALQGGS